MWEMGRRERLGEGRGWSPTSFFISGFSLQVDPVVLRFVGGDQTYPERVRGPRALEGGGARPHSAAPRVSTSLVSALRSVYPHTKGLCFAGLVPLTPVS